MRVVFGQAFSFGEPHRVVESGESLGVTRLIR